jgi:hypothetical protein
MRADRNQSLLVQSREVAKDIPFLEDVQYRDTTVRAHADWTNSWMATKAVWNGAQFFIGWMFIVFFVMSGAIVIEFFISDHPHRILDNLLNGHGF